MKIRRKILMLIPELGYGGAEKSFLRLTHLLSEHHDVQIVVFQRHYAKGNYAQSEENLTLPITILDDQEERGRFSRWKNRWKNFSRLKKESDICISFLTGANILNASVFGKSKTVVSMRGSRHFDPNFSYSKRLLYEFILDPLTFMLSDRIVSISDGLTNELGLHVGKQTKKKIVTIELFIDAKKMIDYCKESVEDNIEKLVDQPLIIAIGRLSQEKGFIPLITVFSKLLVERPDAKLMIIGDGPEKDELTQHCIDLNVQYCEDINDTENSSVLLIGYRKNPCRYFKFANCFVLSSLTEGFSNTTLEALSAGISIIAVNSPWGPRSILSEYPENISEPYPTKKATKTDYGLLMPRIDLSEYQEEWKTYLINILEQPKNQENILNISKKRLFDFDQSIVGKKWFDLIEELENNEK